MDAGANGYILKDASQNEVILAMEEVTEGKIFPSPGISDRIIDALLNRKGRQRPTHCGYPHIPGVGDLLEHGSDSVGLFPCQQDFPRRTLFFQHGHCFVELAGMAFE